MSEPVLITSPTSLPSAKSVERLYAAASAAPPLSEPPSVAALFANVYESSLQAHQIRAVIAQEDNALRGLAYGHPWQWSQHAYPWAFQLKERLGRAAQQLEDSFALNLLAKHPSAPRGLGTQVLDCWLRGLDDQLIWLVTTDVDSPARRLYRSRGFEEIGHGPDAPNGEPALVMIRRP